MSFVRKRIFIILFMAVCLTSCSAIQITPNFSLTDSTESGCIDTETVIEGANSFPNTDSKKYLITDSGEYVYSAATEGTTYESDYCYKDYSELNLRSSTISKSYVDDSKICERQYEILGKDIPIYYEKSFEMVSGLDEFSQSKSDNKYDLYKDSNSNLYYIRQSDSVLLMYRKAKTNKESQDQITQKQITQDEAIQVANTYVEHLLGTTQFDSYTISKNVSQMFNQYWISYTKYLYGYVTSDEIIVCVNYDGSVASYTGLYVSTSNETEQTVCEKTIRAAEEDLVKALNSTQMTNVHVTSKSLEFDVNNGICLLLMVNHGDKYQYHDVFYVKISNS